MHLFDYEDLIHELSPEQKGVFDRTYKRIRRRLQSFGVCRNSSYREKVINPPPTGSYRGSSMPLWNGEYAEYLRYSFGDRVSISFGRTNFVSHARPLPGNEYALVVTIDDEEYYSDEVAQKLRITDVQHDPEVVLLALCRDLTGESAVHREVQRRRLREKQAENTRRASKLSDLLGDPR